MKINEADYVVAVDAANHKQILTVHQALLQERDELRAQVEQLRESAAEAAKTLGFLSHHLRGRMGEVALMDMAEKADALTCAIKATPAQCLAEIKAQAVEDAAKYLSESIPEQSHESVIFKDRYVYISTRYMREYANQLRQAKEHNNA